MFRSAAARRIVGGMLLLLAGLCSTAQAQYLGAERRLLGRGTAGDPVSGFEMDYVRPHLHRWYEPRNLVESYVRPWYVTDESHARQLYQRYVDVSLEGEEWFDGFGTPLGRGWLVYSWTQEQEGAQGSVIRKRPANPGRRAAYSEFFSNLVIASDGDSRSSYRLLIGDQIYTSFTPLTFYKPRFNGMRMDYAADRVMASLVLSRPSEPNRGSLTDATHLMGGHARFDLIDYVALGLTYVNAHTVQTKEAFTAGNPLRGILTTRQNQALQTLWVRIRDDSPGDGSPGAVVFSHDIVLTDTSGNQIRGSEVGFFPFVEGGVTEGASLVAGDADAITLQYDLAGLDIEGLRPSDISRAEVELSLANDYRVEMASDLQNDGQGRQPAPVFLTEARATGNVRDKSNGRVLSLDYSLPTANELIGFDWDVVNWAGLSLQGELVVNRRYGQFPSPNAGSGLFREIDQASAAYSTLIYERHPWTLFAEAFTMDDDFSSNFWLTQANGQVNFRDPVPQLYEFVDDDDDHNALPDWERPFQPWSPVVWPGYDENRDFLYDHNQNGNLLPDYEEPFLRFRSDRPEYLFGLDMNYNGTIDRFENDELPDYPYKRDHRGYNAYIQSKIGPDLSLTLGGQRQRLVTGDGRTRSLYSLVAWQGEVRYLGAARIFNFSARVEDDIPDDQRLWVQPIGAAGRIRDFFDPLAARNTWKNSLYGDLDQRLPAGVRLFHRFKWDYLHQRDSAAIVRGREGRKISGFVGLVNKAEWSIPVGLAVLEPRFKSEFRRQRPFSSRESRLTQIEETASVLWTQPLMAESTGVNYFPRYGRQQFNTTLQTGLELGWIRRYGKLDPGLKRRSRNWTWVGQVTNRVAYLGYNLAVRAGLRFGRVILEEGTSQRTSLFFLTVNAGL
jgi:hypothetical protein